MSSPTLEDMVSAEVRRLAAGAPVEVSLVDGVATLTGVVPDEARRRGIEQGLLQLPQVTDVHNYLRVAPPPGDLRTQLIAMLAREDVRLPALEVQARDGDIAIHGRAETWFDRDAAERLAWTLPGVRAVSNHLVLPEDAVTPDADDGGGLPV
jgi:osmotically-inducible protein OsmY